MQKHNNVSQQFSVKETKILVPNHQLNVVILGHHTDGTAEDLFNLSE